MALSRVAQAGATLLLACALTACSSSSSGPSHPVASTSPSGTATSPPSRSDVNGSVRITIKNFAFQPATVTLRPGDTVTVTNQDSTAHTLTADDKSFDTGTIAPGATATFTAPEKSGAHPYICTIHQFMHGTLTVS
ncbi:cupredoxin domain-containing protein [Kitasatospora sp. NPDC056076]|uniref:cupredoxin domain-containing protein n=1 Tax=Kitasatospora sp. NPDC056076 TaxID=3345703 RepID=UPI0035D65336